MDEIQMVDKSNAFSKMLGLKHSFNIVYSGTMGFKHNPHLIVELCQRLRQHNDIKIVVVSEGLGASYLKKEKNNKRLSNLVLTPFQPFENFSAVLSSADVFLAMLESDAGRLFRTFKSIVLFTCGQTNSFGGTSK